jgi:hypothetical protein
MQSSSCEAGRQHGGKVKLQITHKQLLGRMMKEIRGLRYGYEFDLVRDIMGDF